MVCVEEQRYVRVCVCKHTRVYAKLKTDLFAQELSLSTKSQARKFARKYARKFECVLVSNRIFGKGKN